MENSVKEMVEELKELGERMDKLDAVLKTEGFAEKVGMGQYKLMIQQVGAMVTYYIVLSARIELLKSGGK